MSAKKLFIVFLGVFIAFNFIGCGGSEDPAPQIKPSATGDDLQKILAQMNGEASAAMGKIAGALGNGENPVGDMQGIASLLTQRYNEWRVTADRLCTGSTAPVPNSNGIGTTPGNGLSRQQCEDKFWHFVIQQKGSEVASLVGGASPAMQLKAAETALKIFQGLNINPPQEFLADIQNSIQSFKSTGSLGSGSGSGFGNNSLSQLSNVDLGQLSSLLQGSGLLGVKGSSLNNHPELVTLPLK